MGLNEPSATALLLAIFGLLMAFSVVFTRALDRLGIPVVLLFLLLGMLGGSEGIGGVAFDNHAFAFRVGTIALILILFDGGLNTGRTSIRQSVAAAGMLATVGVAATAGVLSVIGRGLGLGWGEAMLIGAIVSSTDAAAVFAVLRGGSLRVRERDRSVIELESCLNDPMAVILTVTVVEAVGSGAVPGWSLVLTIPVQLASGAATGLGVGYATRWVLDRVRVSTAGLYPVVTLASAFVAFGVATLAHGSGFLAVFVASAVLGNGPLPYKAGLTRVHDAIAWFSQVSMFLMLGLLVFPSQLLPVAGVGLALGLALAVVARPIAVGLCMAPFRWPAKEVGYVSWVGIRGAVPIVLATFPVMADIPGAERIFHIVFFIVVVSAIVPGASIVPLTRRLGLVEAGPPAPAAALEMHSLKRMDGEIRAFHIDPSVAVCGARLRHIHFPPSAAAILIVRGTELLAARGDTRIEAGDHVYVFFRPEDEAYISLLFGRAING